MKNIVTMLCALFFVLSAESSLIQGQTWDENIWSIVKIDPNAPTKVESPNWEPADQTPRFYNIGTGVTVFPNFRPHPTTNTTQSETSVDINLALSLKNPTTEPEI